MPLDLLSDFPLSAVTSENGSLDRNADESSNGNKEQSNVENGGAEDAEKHPNDVENAPDDQKPAVENDGGRESEPLAIEGSQINNVDETYKEEGEPASGNVSQEGDGSTQKPLEPVTESGTISRKIEVPNNKVCLGYVLPCFKAMKHYRISPYLDNIICQITSTHSECLNRHFQMII